MKGEKKITGEDMMKAVILILDDEKVIRELGRDELENMYNKIDKIYAGVWKMQKKSAADFPFYRDMACAYWGELEYQDVICASIGMEKGFWWLKNYALVWKVYDSDGGEIEDLTEGLFYKCVEATFAQKDVSQ